MVTRLRCLSKARVVMTHLRSRGKVVLTSMVGISAGAGAGLQGAGGLQYGSRAALVAVLLEASALPSCRMRCWYLRRRRWVLSLI